MLKWALLHHCFDVETQHSTMHQTLKVSSYAQTEDPQVLSNYCTPYYSLSLSLSPTAGMDVVHERVPHKTESPHVIIRTNGCASQLENAAELLPNALSLSTLSPDTDIVVESSYESQLPDRVTAQQHGSNSLLMANWTKSCSAKKSSFA